MHKPGAGEMQCFFYYHLGFNKAESESSRIVIKHEGSKEDPKIITYIFVKITCPLKGLVSSVV